MHPPFFTYFLLLQYSPTTGGWVGGEGEETTKEMRASVSCRQFVRLPEAKRICAVRSRYPPSQGPSLPVPKSPTPPLRWGPRAHKRNGTVAIQLVYNVNINSHLETFHSHSNERDEKYYFLCYDTHRLQEAWSEEKARRLRKKWKEVSVVNSLCVCVGQNEFVP